MCADRRDELECEEAEGEAYAFSDGRYFGGGAGRTVVDVGLCCEVDDGLYDEGGCHLGSVAYDFQDASRPELGCVKTNKIMLECES